MLEIEQSQAIQLLNDLKGPSWRLYTVLKLVAKGSIVNMTQGQLCEILGVSKKTFNRNIKPLLDYRIEDCPLVRVVRTAEGNTYMLTEFSVKPGDVVKPAAPSKKTALPTNELFDYWMQQYEIAYGVPYQISNFAKEKGHVRTLANRYGGDVPLVKAIIDVVIRLYPSRWKTAQYPRPTLGALISWLSVQAEPLARANLDVKNDPEIVITTTDGKDLFDVYDEAWGFTK